MPRLPKHRLIPLCAAIALCAAGAGPAIAQTAEMPQIEAGIPGGIATVLQNGSGNSATVSQLAVQSGLAPGANTALITQSGMDNRAEIGQEGSGNSAQIAQNGVGNEGVILQRNAGNGAELQQSGNGLSIKIEQFGAAVPGGAPVVVMQSN